MKEQHFYGSVGFHPSAATVLAAGKAPTIFWVGDGVRSTRTSMSEVLVALVHDLVLVRGFPLCTPPWSFAPASSRRRRGGSWSRSWVLAGASCRGGPQGAISLADDELQHLGEAI